MNKKLHIGIDIHGVIDRYKGLFRNLSSRWARMDHRVSIITGQEWSKVKPEVDKAGIIYTDHFSIVDYHLSIGTKVWRDEKNTVWMDPETWIRSKGDYCHREHVDLHFDDSHEYGNYMPDFTLFVLVPKQNFPETFYEAFKGFTD